MLLFVGHVCQSHTVIQIAQKLLILTKASVQLHIYQMYMF